MVGVKEVTEKNPPVVEGLQFIGMAAVKTAGAGLAGALWGHIYAKLAGFPADKARVAFGVFSASAMAFNSLVNGLTKIFIKNHAYRFLTRAVAGAAAGAIGTFELHRRGLIGEKLLICYVVIIIASLVYLTTFALFAGPIDKTKNDGPFIWHWDIKKNFT